MERRKKKECERKDAPLPYTTIDNLQESVSEKNSKMKGTEFKQADLAYVFFV